MISNKIFFQYINSKTIIIPEYSTETAGFYDKLWNVEYGCCYEDSLIAIVRLAKSIGAFSVLPHFGQLFNNDINLMTKQRALNIQLLTVLKDAGLFGLEIHPYMNHPNKSLINEEVQSLSKSVGLSITYGTDYHGITGKNIFDIKDCGSFDGFYYNQ